MNQQTAAFNRARLRAVLAVREQPLTSLAADAGCSLRHLELVLRGKRTLTDRLRAGLHRAIGADAWAFIVGQSDTLTPAHPAHG